MESFHDVYFMIAAAVLALMVWAGMRGRPEDFTGGNCVWLKDGKPGVYGSPEPRWTCARRPDVEPKELINLFPTHKAS